LAENSTGVCITLPRQPCLATLQLCGAQVKIY
jgi:hypothetical protein